MGSQDHFRANKRLNKNELLNITGGASITGSLVNAFTDAFRMVHEIGKSLGSSIIRIHEKTFCKLE